MAVGDDSSGRESDSSTRTDEKMYSFTQKSCRKTAGPGVVVQSQRLTRNRNEVASELTVGDFVLFDKHDDGIEPIWPGRAMPNPEWKGQGVYKNMQRGKISCRGVAVSQREVAIYVMWYEKRM